MGDSQFTMSWRPRSKELSITVSDSGKFLSVLTAMIHLQYCNTICDFQYVVAHFGDIIFNC
jgi:hypothetical protein